MRSDSTLRLNLDQLSVPAGESVLATFVGNMG